MPFITRCPYCTKAVRMPDRALGASMKCPACQAWYTAAPDLDAPPPRRARSRAELDATPLAPDEPTPLAPPEDSPIAVLEDSPSPIGSSGYEPMMVMPGADVPLEGKFLNVAGVVACVGACLAALVASFYDTAFLTRPVAFAAVIAGMGSLLLTLGSKPIAFVLPAIGTGVSTLILLIAFISPGTLSPQYEASRQTSTYDPNAILLIPLTLETGALDVDGWADASRAAVQQGPIRVQIMNVKLGPVDLEQRNGIKPQPTKERYLSILVRLQHVGSGGPVTFTSWTDGAVLERGGKRSTPLSLAPRHVAGQLEEPYPLHPGRLVGTVLVFESSASPEACRLELPTEAWGGQGSFRFSIPPSMIASRPASPNR